MTIKCFWQICQKWVWEIACYSCYMGGVGSVLAWVARLRGWCASVGRMLLLLLLLLFKNYPEEKNVEWLRLKWKNAPNRSKQLFKRRTWLEEQVLLYISWTSNAKILNMAESWWQWGQICLNMCNFVNMPGNAWNITCLKAWVLNVSNSAQI